MTSSTKTKDCWILPLLVLVYGLCAFRYFPERLTDSLQETATHILTTVPFTMGFTLLFSAIFYRFTGERMGRHALVRIFLTACIIMEFLIGLYNYLARAAPP